MALDATHWSITAGGDIRYGGPAHGVSGATYVTTIDLHRWLQDLADDASSAGDDLLDITNTTPSERNGTDNNITIYAPYNIDQTAAEHIYDGSIAQAGGDDIWDGFVNYGNEGINIQVLQNGAYEANDFWNSLPFGGSLTGLNRDVANGISHRFMLKVRTAGVDIDGRRVIGMSRELGKTYAEFKVNGTVRGNNTLALVNAVDLNNATAKATIEGWVSITNTEGYRAIDVDIDGTPEHYYSEYNKGTQTINDLYEYVKMETAYDRVGTLYGIDGKIFRGVTHEFAVNTPTGTFVEPEAISWGAGATAGTAQLLAIDSTTAGTKMWVQLLTGVIPTATEVITGVSTATAITASVTEQTVSPVVIGASTGTAIIGAYGFGVEALDLSAADKVFALEDPATPITPPDYKTTKVTGLVDGDRVLVGPDGGSTTLQDDQLQVSTAITSGATTIIMKTSATGETIGTGTQFATDCPAGGGLISALRVKDDAGIFWRIPYSEVVHGAGIATYTVLGADTTGLTAGIDNLGFMGYIDAAETGADAEIQFTTVFHSARSLFVRVRDGGASPIKTFESTVAVGASIGAIRGADD